MSLSRSLQEFFVQLHDTLMADLDAVVDWQLDVHGTSYCFRVALPDLSQADMQGRPPSLDPEALPGQPILVEDSEHLCPITYLAFRLGLGCYDVVAANRAAQKLKLSEAVRDAIISAADQPHTQDVLYWQLRGLFEQKEQQLLALFGSELLHTTPAGVS